MKPDLIERAVKNVVETTEESEMVRHVCDLYDTLLARARTLDNPYLDAFNKLHRNPRYTHAMDVMRGRVIDDENWNKLEIRQEGMRRLRNHKFSSAVPTPEALATIGEHGPILEAGAGTGYWSHMLRKMNVDVVAFDRDAANIRLNRWHKLTNRSWTDMVTGTAQTVDLYPNRALFMSMPPPASTFANDVLSRYKGTTFFFIGDSLPNRTTANPEFYTNLAGSWREVKTVQLPNWETDFGLNQYNLQVFDRT